MTTDPKRKEAPNVKPGYKTTEFWLTALASLMSLLILSDAIPTDSLLEKLVGVVSTVLGALGYAVVRTYAKRPPGPPASSNQTPSGTGGDKR